ncbi:unnamed protein product [Schistosoma rodhaini]|uniref:Uncharacterized protein n=1 Tax=Schistosoma rodhaini TaxID=6188 RepID=A0AA85FN87_9TREM|nr:unnamed protein product [Schistosoma rodhaini]
MTSSECKSKINSTIECPVTHVNNNQKQMNIGRPPSSISLITDQLKLSSLNERDSCMSMRTMKMTVGVMPTTTSTTSKSMYTGQHNINCESYGLKTRNAYSMPIHSIIGLQLKRNITSNDNDSTNNNNTDWRSGSKDYHHSRTVHFHDVFAPSSSVCSSLRSTMSEFEDGNEIINLEPNSSSLHVLSASAPATNYSLNSMSNVLKFNEIQSCQQHYHHIDHPYHPHLHHRHHHHHHQINNSNNNTVTPSTSTFNFSSASFPCSVDDKVDHMNVLINQFNVPCKTVCSSPFSSSSSSTSCYFCSVCCSCCLFEVNNPSYSHIQHLHDLLPPAKRVCRSTSSSSDMHSQTSSYGYSCRPFPFIMSSCSCSLSSHIPPQPSSVSSYRHCHKCNNNDSNNNNNQHSSAAMLKTMQSYMRTLPRPIAVRLDSKIVYNEKSKSCTNMDNVKLLNSNDNNTNNGGGTLRNNNNNNDHGVILRPKPLDLNSFNKMNNGSRISWHHPLFNFGSGAAQTKCSNNNGNNLSSQTEVGEVTLQHNNSPTDFPQAHSDNLQKSVRLRNRTTHSNSSGGNSIHINNSNNKSHFDRVHHRPSHIEIKDSQYSSLSIHALPSPSSAFTPTRASFGSFPMDVNSSEFSLSPTTESISSSIQITTRTPSSGFHEASFFGLSEASSLPDCSRFGVSSDSGPSSNHHCNCNCHQRRQQHYHHHHRRNQTNISIDNKSLNQSGDISSKLTDLEPCFKLEDSEPNINDNHQSRNTSSSSSSSNSDSGSYCCSYSLPSVKCMLRCCSQPNDDTIYDINYRHSPHCSRTLKHIHQSPTTTTTNTTTCTFFTTISTTAMMITTKTSTTTSSNITIANTAAGLKRRRGPSGECNNQYYRDTDFHNESNNYHHHTHEEERKQLLAHEELLPCNCCMFKRTTDQLKNNHDGKSLSDIEHLNYMSTILSNSRLDDTLDCHHRHHYHQHHQSTCQCHDVQRHSMFPSIDQHSSMIPSYSCSSAISKCLSIFDAHKCQDNATLSESDIHDEHYHYLSSTASSIKHCTQSNLKNTTLMMDNNENGKITEAVNDNSCSVANSLRNPCYISSYEHCPSVFSEENLIHRYTYNELGKLYEMTEDEKEHETPETMIDENSNNGRISETNYHHPIIPLSSPSIYEIAFTPIHPSTNIEWDNSDDRNSDSCGIPVHDHPDVLLNESVDTNLKDDSTGRQVLLFTPSSTSSNSDRESDDMKSILSPQTPNRQRTCSDILQEKSNNNKQTLSFTDLDLELIEND